VGFKARKQTIELGDLVAIPVRIGHWQNNVDRRINPIWLVTGSDFVYGVVDCVNGDGSLDGHTKVSYVDHNSASYTWAWEETDSLIIIMKDAKLKSLKRKQK